MQVVVFSDFTLEITLPRLVHLLLCLHEKEFCNLLNGVFQGFF